MQDKVALTGKIKITLAQLSSPREWKLYDEIISRIKKGRQFMELVRELNRICSSKIWEQANLNPLVGRSMIMNNLTSASPTDDPKINYTALGTGTTAPANSDTKLETEVFRKVVSSATNSDNVGYVTAFYTAAETDGTYKEVGLFSNGTAVADSGVLVVHTAVNITKTNTSTLTIDHTLTLA